MPINIIVFKNCLEVCLFPLFMFIQENACSLLNGCRSLGESNRSRLEFYHTPVNYLQALSSVMLLPHWKSPASMSCYDSEHWLTSVISYDTDLWFCQEELENSPLCVSSSSSLVMTNLDSILKSRDIILATKFHLVKAMVFPVVMYGCESWAIKKAECRRIDAFEQWRWRRLLRVPWTARRSNQSILKEISPECSLEGLMLKLKLQSFGHLMQSWLIGKDPDARKDWGQEEKGATEDEMVGWHHWLDGHESEQTLGDKEGQGSQKCYNSWGRKEMYTT